MIIKCYLCNQYKFWNAKTGYQVQVTSNDGTKDLFSKKICKSCGEQIDNVYNSGKQIAELGDNYVEETDSK